MVIISASITMFGIGLLGVLVTFRNFLTIMFGLEMLFLPISILFIYFSNYLDDLLGQIFAILILTVAASESAIGLAIITVYYNVYSNISVQNISVLKG